MAASTGTGPQGFAEAAIVTRAADPIGQATMRRLAADGALVIGIDADPPSDPPGEFYRADPTDGAAMAALLADLASRHRVTRLVNNVAWSLPGALDRLDGPTCDEALLASLGKALMCVNAVVPGMRRQGFGRIVNVLGTSVGGRAGSSLATAADGGLLGLVRTWALEFMPDGITVNAVAPGPIGEAADAATDVAHAVAFLLDPRSGSVTGQMLSVCGGRSLGTLPT